MCVENACHLQPMPFKSLPTLKPAPVPCGSVVTIMIHPVNLVALRRTQANSYSLSARAQLKSCGQAMGNPKCAQQRGPSPHHCPEMQRGSRLPQPAKQRPRGGSHAGVRAGKQGHRDQQVLGEEAK